MIKEIKYVFTSSVNYYTCHSLFATITDNQLHDLKLNAYSKQPEYKVSFLDREITILINDEDLEIKCLPKEIIFNNDGKEIKGFLKSISDYTVKSNFKKNDYVILRGTVSYAGKKMVGGKLKNICPITVYGNFVEGMRGLTLEYLSKKTGVKLLEDSRLFRFEIMTYKQFKLSKDVISKSSGQRLSLHNVFYFEIMGYVENEEVLNKLDYTSFGKKRDYGFGNVSVIKYEQETI